MWLLKLLRKIIEKVSRFLYGATLVIGRLFGVKEISPGKFDPQRFYSAVWVFLIGIPLGLILFGIEFSLIIWTAVILGLLAIVNLDESLIIMCFLIENGVTGEVLGEEACSSILSPA